MFPERIETDRLSLDRHDVAVDAPTLYHAAGRGGGTIAEETTYLSWTPHDHPKESHDVNRRFRGAWEACESATYAVFPREGEAGLGVDWETRTATLGIWLRKRFWGRGYSGERAVALASLAFDRLDLDLLSVGVIPDDEGSVRAVERYVDRMGGRREGRLRNWLAPDGGNRSTSSATRCRARSTTTLSATGGRTVRRGTAGRRAVRPVGRSGGVPLPYSRFAARSRSAASRTASRAP